MLSREEVLRKRSAILCDHARTLSRSMDALIVESQRIRRRVSAIQAYFYTVLSTYAQHRDA